MTRFSRSPGLIIRRSLHQGSSAEPQRKPRTVLHRRRVRLAKYPQPITLAERTGPTKRRFPVFDLPDVVIDLDAEDHPHVRPFDEESDGAAQDAKWGYDPAIPGLKDQVAKLVQNIRRDTKAMSRGARTPFAASQISDHDVLRIALFGGSRVADMLRLDQARPQPLRNCGLELSIALSRNGIPKPILDLPADRVIPFMLHRQQLAIAALHDPSLRETSSHPDAFRAALDECRDLYRLSKLCSRVESPSSGVDISAESMEHVHSRLLDLLKGNFDRSSPEAILKFVNNITIKRLTCGKGLPRSLTLLGLQLASSQGVLPCILQYLQITLSMGFINESDEATSLTRLQTGRAILAALERGEGAARGTRQQIFTLVTGMSLEALEPQPSLLGLNTEDRQKRPDTFDVRVRLLGELGSVRLLWHQSRGHGNDVMAMALHRGTQVLSSASDGVSGMDLMTATGDVGRDAALDLQTMNALDVFHTNRGSKIPRPSLLSLEKQVSAEKMKEAFDVADLSQAMACFKKTVDRARAQQKTAARKEHVVEEKVQVETSEKETSDEETSNMETSGKETSGKETSGKEASEKETSEEETSKMETSEMETSGKDTCDKETSEKETSEMETSEKETNGMNTSDKEINVKDT